MHGADADQSRFRVEGKPVRKGIPRPRTPLVGRRQTIATVLQLIQRHDVGLVTLTGPGGVGKTRVALQAATDAIPVFAEGAVFVPLADLRDADHI